MFTIHTCANTHVHTSTHTKTHMYALSHTVTHSQTSTHARARTSTHTRTHARTHTHTHTHTHTKCMHASAHIQRFSQRGAHMYACKHACWNVSLPSTPPTAMCRQVSVSQGPGPRRPPVLMKDRRVEGGEREIRCLQSGPPWLVPRVGSRELVSVVSDVLVRPVMRDADRMASTDRSSPKGWYSQE